MVPWTEAAERRLLLTYIQVTNPGAADWKVIAARTGLDLSKEACRQRFQKIKREDAEAFSAANDTTGDTGYGDTDFSANAKAVDGTDTPVTTPKSKAKRAPRTPKSKSTGGKRAAKLLTGEEDNEEEAETPTKKQKVIKPVKEEAVQEEAVQEEPVKEEPVEAEADQV